MVTAKQVASYFIEKASRLNENNDLTNLKLQKMLYFAQVEHLKKYGEPLFDDEIQAWRYGPVVKDVYNWLMEAGCGPYVVTEFDVMLEDLSDMPMNTRDFLDGIWEKYLKYSAWGLVKKTHEKGSAWDKVYNNGVGEKQTIDINLLKQTATL